ncbi:uncharacterized protein LOC105251705 [Camponotus floridanus]|uniref:uncharacterized protein LOC105251705 n=1 Tax=Camponotus floridanus TaxID=104421 RepID=UPI00059CB7DD|nr:uncharacterized protein LOC105251705 [Camponotus floridanus]
MSNIVLVRAFKSGDEKSCKELIRNSVMSSLTPTFRGMLFKEITFQLVILLSAITFIFFGMPLNVCLVVIPIVVILVYIGTCISFVIKLAEIDEEISNIPRLYMSNRFSRFWVAEAIQPNLVTQHPKEVHYTILTEQQYCQANMGVSLQAKKIVGTICLTKSHTLDKCAWIKRLCVHKQYQRKGIATCLLNTAVEFAIEAGYSCANIVASQYTEGGKELCLKKGFELKQIYHKSILGSYVMILMYELSYQIKPSEDDYLPCIGKYYLNHY